MDREAVEPNPLRFRQQGPGLAAERRSGRFTTGARAQETGCAGGRVLEVGAQQLARLTQQKESGAVGAGGRVRDVGEVAFHHARRRGSQPVPRRVYPVGGQEGESSVGKRAEAGDGRQRGRERRGHRRPIFLHFQHAAVSRRRRLGQEWPLRQCR